MSFNVVNDFISEDEEEYILSYISSNEVRKTKGRSSIKRYGTKVYGTSMVSKNLPDWSVFLTNRLVEKDYLKNLPKHITVNKYDIGSFILPHIDVKQSGEIITVLSVLGDTNMILNNAKQEQITVFLPKRSLLQLKEEHRYNWQHSIPITTEPRYSIVFRD